MNKDSRRISLETRRLFCKTDLLFVTMRFLIFERTLGHCVTEFVQAPSLREALTLYAVNVFSAQVNEEGYLARNSRVKPVYVHPLEFIEAHCKATSDFDELEWDQKNDRLLNGSSWEIRLLPEQAWQAAFAEVFCSAEPRSLGEYIQLCRQPFRRQFPRSRARAFVWYLQDGPLVTFYRRKGGGEAIEVLERYIIPWQRQKYPNAYTLAPDMVEEWRGTYDDLLAQMKVEFPF